MVFAKSYRFDMKGFNLSRSVWSEKRRFLAIYWEYKELAVKSQNLSKFYLIQIKGFRRKYESL